VQSVVLLSVLLDVRVTMGLLVTLVLMLLLSLVLPSFVRRPLACPCLVMFRVRVASSGAAASSGGGHRMSQD